MWEDDAAASTMRLFGVSETLPLQLLFCVDVFVLSLSQLPPL